jgi:hypothetical protein
MRRRSALGPRMTLALTVSIALGLALAGCAHAPARTAEVAPGVPRPDATVEPDGAEMWARTCARCHALRPPDEFSYDQWEVIVEHMRVRATLPAEKTRTILRFLKAAE